MLIQHTLCFSKYSKSGVLKKIVRDLIDIVKSKQGIIVVNIDHHEYNSDDLVKIGVIKEDVKTSSYLTDAYVKKSETYLDMLLGYFDLSHRYVKLKNEEKSIKYPPNVKLGKIQDNYCMV